MAKSKYQQIIDDIRYKIEEKIYQESDRLPSIRQLSQDYHCNKDTVQRALLELKYLHYIYPIYKSGYYVLGNPKEEDTLPLPQDNQSQPAYEDFLICLNETLIGRESYLFNYYHKQEGLDELVKSVQKLLLNYDVYTRSESIVITSGTQQALYILSQMDFPNQKREILLEQPTYPRMNNLIKEQGLPYRTVKRGMDGLDLASLEEIFKEGKTKFFYTIPRIQTPLGVTYSLKEKQALVKLADKYDVYIIEDDYMADYDDKNNLPLHYLDTHDRVIYMKSFSTTLFPALRLGAVVLPQPLLKEFLNYKKLMDYDTNLIMQKALSLYIDNGMFLKNRQKLQDNYTFKRQEVARELEQLNFPYPCHFVRDTITIQLPPTVNVKALQYSSLPLHFLEPFYIDHCPDTYIQLSFEKGKLTNNLDQITQLLADSKKEKT